MADEKPPKPVAVKPPEPPPNEEPKKPPKQSTSKPRGRPLKRETKLVEFFTNIGMLVSAFNMADGQIIALNAEGLANSWAKLAAENAKVAAAIDRLTSGGAWGGVLFSSLAVVVPIMQNHGISLPLPPMALGIQPDEEPPSPPA